MTIIDRVLKLLALASLTFLVGVQLGIAHGRWLTMREVHTSVSFVDTTCLEEISTIRLRVVATGYSSTPDQTDDTPFITASGTRVRLGTLAVSRDLLQLLPFGTRLYVVEDTMHTRWTHRLDLWFPSRNAALRFGTPHMILKAKP